MKVGAWRVAQRDGCSVVYEGLILAAGAGLAWCVSVMRRRAERQQRNYRSLAEILEEEALHGPRRLPPPAPRQYTSYTDQPLAFRAPEPQAQAPNVARFGRGAA